LFGVAEVDPPTSRRQLCGGSKPAVERMLEFGRELYNMSLHLRQEQGKNENNKKMLQVHNSVTKHSSLMSFMMNSFKNYSVLFVCISLVCRKP